MLTRLKVNGFKNLVDVDVRFGPFTCIAGANGVGKSNLFDAIRFLSALADFPLVEAALIALRGNDVTKYGVRNLFRRVGDTYETEMSFEVEMLIPRTGIDELGQSITASTTLLRYKLVLGLMKNLTFPISFPLQFGDTDLRVLEETLEPLDNLEVAATLKFLPTLEIWSNAIVVGTNPIISTSSDDGKPVFTLYHPNHSETFRTILPRTILSSANAAIHSTALLVKQELQSWRIFHFDPTILRLPNTFEDKADLAPNGANLTALIYRLAQQSTDPERVYVELANRLSELWDEIRTIRVDLDPQRQLLTLQAKTPDDTWHDARALSDGTLRFLAMAALALDRQDTGLVGIEEPENGFHPKRIAALIQLIHDMVVSPKYPIDENNPMRQIIITTHSAALIQQVEDQALLLLAERNFLRNGKRFQSAYIMALPDTWRAAAGMPTVALGDLITFLNPVPYHSDEPNRLVDRADLKPLLPWS
jgi:predicted ATPase